MKKAFLPIMAFLMVFAACTKEGSVIYVPDPDDQSDGSPLVTVIYDPGALGDMTYNDLIYAGVERAAVRNGLRTLQLSPRDRNEGLSYLSKVMDQMCTARDTVRRLLIVAGTGYDEYLRANNKRLEANPKSDLLYFETVEPLSGKGSSVHIDFYGAMYEAGAVTPVFSSEVLLVAANPKVFTITEAVQGFRDGFATAWTGEPEKERKVFQEYLASDAGSGFDIEDGKALTLMYTQPWTSDTRMIVPVCGGAGATFRRLAENTNEFKVMGIDRALVSTISYYSAVKHSDEVVARCIGQWVSDEGMPKHQTFGLADGVTGMEFHPADPGFYDTLYALVSKETLQAIHQEAIEKEAQYGK